ncbi:MAG TPA: polymer-forming cytoskeletal protein [Turneriella sp.]|nr:polymer-forming cytoskeletal protein [Turneriella sp.]
MATRDPKRRQDATVFAQGSAFKGTLEFAKPLRILGGYEGEIKGSEYLEIGPEAKVNAHIDAAYVVIYGQVTGNVVATEKVELKEGAKLVGNIRSPKLEVDDGVIFEGLCEMKSATEAVV